MQSPSPRPRALPEWKVFMTDESQAQLHPEFRKFIELQPYTVELDGLRLAVDEDVFPPDMGRCAQNLVRLAKEYRPHAALDMGCGSGYIALMLKKWGAEVVWASDVHPPAVACARKNVATNAAIGPIEVVESDLFAAIPRDVKFDLIVFNQPFGPGHGKTVCGCGADGGYEICKRFLGEAPNYLAANGAVLMAFSDREAAEHRPDGVARELGLHVKTVLHLFYNESHNYIFEIRPGP